MSYKILQSSPHAKESPKISPIRKEEEEKNIENEEKKFEDAKEQGRKYYESRGMGLRKEFVRREFRKEWDERRY